MFLKFPFFFHFRSSLSFTFTFQILFDLVLHLLFYLVFVLLYLLSFSALFIPRNFLSQKVGWRPPVSCFNFYFIAVLIYYLYFIIYRRAHNVFGTLLWESFLVEFVVAGFELVKKWDLETLCFLRWCVGVFLTFKEPCIINF